MSNKYTKWNKAETYKKNNIDVVDVFSGQESCFFQYKATRVYLLDTYRDTCHSPLDIIDLEILARIMASRIIVVEQIFCYLYMQGINITMQELIHRLQILHSKGMVKKGIIINGRKKVFINYTYYENMEFYETTQLGENFLRSRRLQQLSKRQYSREWTEGSWYEYVRSSIMWNQVILKLLLSNNSINNFNIHFLYREKDVSARGIHVPLLISTKKRIYVFEFVRGIRPGKEIVQSKYVQWSNHPLLYGKKINLVYLCENEYHMELMASCLKEFISENAIPVYFSNDELWFGLDKCKIRKMCFDEGSLKKNKFI